MVAAEVAALKLKIRGNGNDDDRWNEVFNLSVLKFSSITFLTVTVKRVRSML